MYFKALRLDDEWYGVGDEMMFVGLRALRSNCILKGEKMKIVELMMSIIGLDKRLI